MEHKAPNLIYEYKSPKSFKQTLKILNEKYGMDILILTNAFLLIRLFFMIREIN